MATERFNRQFILLDFEDLDNPEFMEFVRSPEFSTYLTMRRYIWRSDKAHSLGLHEYYAQGLLACSLSREKIAEALGGVTPRTVTKDINALIERRVIKSVSTGRGNIFILGKWATDEEEGVYYEYFFLDRLHLRLEENFQSEEEPGPTSLGGRKLPTRSEENFQPAEKPNPGGRKLPDSLEETNRPDRQEPSNSNIEENSRKENREDSKDSKDLPSNFSPKTTQTPSPLMETYIDTCTREFWDEDHLSSNISRTYNLWARTGLGEEEFVAKILEARKITKERISLSAVHDRGKKMAYFFAVLEDVL
ncbi:MAG: hypothetical protein ACE5H9_13905, partial [Anaerolineae bacterium]